MAFNYTRGHVHHAAVVRMWLLCLFQRAVMKKLTSASRIILFPSGQMTWSTWERTLSQVSSGVRRLAWRMRTSIAFACFSIRNTLMGVPWALVGCSSLPRRSPCLSGPCCTRWSRFSSGPAGLWSPRSCSLWRNHDHSPPVEDVSGSYQNVPLHERFPRSTVGRAVTSARDDDINLTDDLVQLDYSESIHAEANEEGRTGWNVIWQMMDLAGGQRSLGSELNHYTI